VSGNSGSMRSVSEEEFEQTILQLLARRREGATICPSDVARAVDKGGWRQLMDPVRDAAGRLADRGEVDITQAGRVVDLTTARGPIRIRRHTSR
jgi:hypothetical protein